MTATPLALEIEDLKFRYSRSGADVVDVHHLMLAGDEQLLISGPSGSGKSTLLSLAAGLIDPSQGRVRVSGQLLGQLSPARRDRFRGRTIGMIFQTFNLLDAFSAIENVMLAMVVSDIPPREHRERAANLLDELSLSQHSARVDRLSVGQRQRVAVARAIACRPALVLADEPTASLDPDNARAALDLITATCASHDAALLCTSHDPAVVDRFPRTVALENLAATSAEAH